MSKAVVHDLETLRRQLSDEAPYLGPKGHRATGIRELDQLLSQGGIPKGALTVLGGPAGSGRTSLVARILAHETQNERPVAWIDARGLVYPPALEQLGVALQRLLLVRVEVGRALYAAEQVLSSGAFRFVAMSGFDGHLSSSRIRRLQNAAESSDATGLIVFGSSVPTPRTSTALELHLERQAKGAWVSIVRDRSGPTHRKSFVPFFGEDGPLQPAA